MSRRRYSFDEEKIARYHKEGRGLGTGVEYQPWLSIQDVPSCGRSHRLRGMTVGRLHHFFSDIECNLFYLLDWADNVLDIREQFPLDRHTTQRIAEEIKVIHPVDRSNKTPIVMTTDFVIDVKMVGREKQMARAVKSSKELDKPRTIEKLEIERRFWEEKGVEWGIVTERNIPQNLVRNISWIHNYRYIDELAQPYPGYYVEKSQLLMKELELCSCLTLKQFCVRVDSKLSLTTGISMMLMRHLIASKMISCDMSEPIDQSVDIERFQLSLRQGAPRNECAVSQPAA